MAGTAEEPKGVLTPVRVERRGEGSEQAVYVRVICLDEDGREFYFEASAFSCDLKAYKP